MTGTTGVWTDDRARVPFAVVGVLLLVSSLALVGYVDTRESAEPETDATLAMDRTEAAVQTALRDGAVRAAERAAEQPVTDPADTDYGAVLDEDRPFRSYLEGLVYLEVADRLDAVGQQVGDVATRAALPPVTDTESFATVIDRVSVTAGGTDDGLLTVELDGVEMTGERNGAVFEQRTESMTVSVPTPVLQLHDRTEQFQERLDAPVHRSGLTQRFNARIYAMGWARGYAQYGGAPVTEVIANRHVEPAVNSALYRTQQDVFGAADPRLENAVRRGWLCMAAQDAEELYGSYTADTVGGAGDVCDVSEWLLGDRHTGALPDAPGTLDLLGSAPGMDAEHTIGVNETAYLPLRTLLQSSGANSISGAIDRIFTVEAALDTTLETEPPAFAHERPDPVATQAQAEREHSHVTIGSVTLDRPAANETYASIEFDGAITVTERQHWTWQSGDGEQNSAVTVDNDSITITGSLELEEGTLSSDANLREMTDIHIDRAYERGPESPADERTVPTPPAGFPNFADAEDDILASIFGGASAPAVGAWLRSQWAGVTESSDVGLPDTATADLDHEAMLSSALEETIVDDLGTLQEEMETITHTFERSDLVHDGTGDGPFDELHDRVLEEMDAMLDREASFENVGQVAVYEARYAYFAQLLADLERVAQAHTTAMDSLDQGLQEVDSSLDRTLSFLQQGLDAAEPDPVPIESPAVTPDVTYEVTGSPTYLAAENITRGDVPAVDPDTDFAPLSMANENYLKLPYESIVSGLLDSILNVVGIGDPDAELTFRTAGEALQAGELAVVAGQDDEYADTAQLAALTDVLRDELDQAIDRFGAQLSRTLTDELYLEADESLSESGPVPEPPDGTLRESIPEGAPVEMVEGTADALEAYDGAAGMAIAIGNGNVTGPLVEELTARLSASAYRPEYADGLSESGWADVVESAVRPAVDRAASAETVTLSDTDTVEELDTETRRALENVSRDMLEDRLDEFEGRGQFDLAEYEDWVDGVETPLRVPAGLPLLPLPTNWYATINMWDVDAMGTYARFEATAHVGSPGDGSSTTYVRENRTATLDIAEDTRVLGGVEPIRFETESLLVVVVPPGGVGVGDRDDEDPECSPTYPEIGVVDPDEIACGDEQW